MDESEHGGVKHQSRRVEEGAGPAARVDAIADQRVLHLAHVNADLMRTPGLQAALDEGREAARLHAFDVRDRFARVRRGLPARRTTQPVAAVLDEKTTNRPRLDVAMRDREVSPVDRMPSELMGEALLGQPGAREYDEPAGLLVDSVDNSQVRPRGTAPF